MSVISCQLSVVSCNDSIIVITGPWQPLPDQIKPELPVPNYYYKVIFDISPPDYKAVAFLLKNDTASGMVAEYAISIDSLEQYLGYDFFKELDSSVMMLIEAEASVDAWVIKGD
ncbi:MAG: DNA/RNA non-specific endonuclease [Bacteroidota bacterium]|nr:DNA/RNA non-specific endonuclease [Bacteroidota bacterium]